MSTTMFHTVAETSLANKTGFAKADPIRAPSANEGIVGAVKSFAGFTKVAIGSGIAGLCLCFFVYCLCRRSGARSGAGKVPPAEELPQVVGSSNKTGTVSNRGGNAQHNEENDSLVRNMEKNQETEI